MKAKLKQLSEIVIIGFSVLAIQIFNFVFGEQSMVNSKSTDNLFLNYDYYEF
jgi:hypothetical protein